MSEYLFQDMDGPTTSTTHGAYGRSSRTTAAAPFSNGSTSKAAARLIEPDLNRLESMVLEHVRSCGEHGATRQETEDGTGLGGDTVRPRADRLLKLGLLTETDRERPTRSGRMARVIVAAEFAGGHP